MINFLSITGTITAIDDIWINESKETLGCYKQISIQDDNGNTTNFVVSPDTYILNNEILLPGDMVTGYYDGNAPVILIYPPQYRALVMHKTRSFPNIKVSYFNSQFISSDNQLKLNISPSTLMVIRNGQLFSQNPANHNLLVIYGATTRSIPAQTTPIEIIVLC
ncbi:hypothetical protein R0131_14410 [Clostridium sp. AL.422]|uniref:hypothetical protein n=1 Tax=Clostridium TaxID=1485 RepID=UPI00293DCAE3|nr:MULTISPECIES: hypothetical protein [unclassified Clostridium]MDV4152018.1 hypothetical protein [Clostridium sp. AL.422]